jgi:hypothetical protein
LNYMDFYLFDFFRKIIEDNHTSCFRNYVDEVRFIL